MIIGIAARKGHGKTAIGQYLYVEHDYSQLAFADNLKIAAKLIFRLSDAQVYGTIKEKETLDPRWDKTPREIMQLFGTEVGRNIDPDVWVKSVKAMIDENPDLDYVVDDVRFPNEAEAIQAWGGKIIKVIRPGFGTESGNQHASEVEVGNIIPDITIINNGTLVELEKLIDFIIDDRRLDQADDVYPAAPCYSNSGYTCGRDCGLSISDCIEQHYVRDHNHHFRGWEEHVSVGHDGKEYVSGGTTVCIACGLSAMDHDMTRGP